MWDQKCRSQTRHYSIPGHSASYSTRRFWEAITMNKMQVALTDPCIFVICHVELEGKIPKATLFTELNLWIMNILGPKAYAWQSAWIWDKHRINGKLWLSLRVQSESRMIIRKDVKHCHHLSWKEGSRASNIMESGRRGICSYLWKHGWFIFSSFWVNNLTNNDEYRSIESPQSTAQGLSSLATISTLQNHLSLSSVPGRSLPPVLDLVGCSFFFLRNISSC